MRDLDLHALFLFNVTDIGRAAVTATADPKPKLTRAQRRYKAYLDSDSGLRFSEWLRSHTVFAAPVEGGAL